METFWFFLFQFRRAYDSAYVSAFLFSLGHKRSYNSAYDFDSVAGEPLYQPFSPMSGQHQFSPNNYPYIIERKG